MNETEETNIWKSNTLDNSSKEYPVIVYKAYMAYIFSIYFLLLFFTPVIASRFLSNDGVAVLFVVLTIGFALVFSQFKEFFVEEKLIELHPNKLIIKCNKIMEISFTDIKEYNITWGTKRAINLVITLKNGDKVKLGISKLFGETGGLETFVGDFSKTMAQLDLSNGMPVKRKKSYWESSWMLALIIVMTIAMALNIFLWSWIHKPVPTPIWVFSAMTGVYWSVYLTTRNKNKGN